MNEEYKICPRCQLEINADSRICRKCFFNLRDIEIKTRVSDIQNKTFVDKATRLKIPPNRMTTPVHYIALNVSQKRDTPQ